MMPRFSNGAPGKPRRFLTAWLRWALAGLSTSAKTRSVNHVTRYRSSAVVHLRAPALQPRLRGSHRCQLRPLLCQLISRTDHHPIEQPGQIDRQRPDRRVHHGTPLLSFLQAKEGCARVTRYYYSRRSGCDIEEGCVCKKSRRTGSSAADSQPVVQERFGTLGRYVRGRRRGRWALHRRLQKMLKKKWFLCVAILQPAEHATVPARHHIPRRDSGGCLAVLARVCCCCRRRRRRRRRR
jgi:hypothetical protein